MLIAVNVLAIMVSGCQTELPAAGLTTTNDSPFIIRSDLQSRSISFENMTGEKGGGGKAASPLGPGRKGAPTRDILPGETIELANIDGPGMIRHIWMTLWKTPEDMRSLVIRVYWDGQEHPSIEAPVGDFFGFAHGHTSAFESAVHSVSELYGMNIWLPMPFRENARVTLTNEADHFIGVFFNIDYTLGDSLPQDVGRLHVAFDRQNLTTLKEDFELLPRREGRGRYIGAVIGVRPLTYVEGHDWWGEGEVKIYLDGDEEYPTINGTGAEDYVGQAFGVQPTSAAFHGASYVDEDDAGQRYVSMYRWHLPDPIYWQEDIRVTMQQIGWGEKPWEGEGEPDSAWYLSELFEREDDYSVAAFWYEAIPSAPLPEFPSLEERLADLPQVPEQ